MRGLMEDKMGKLIRTTWTVTNAQIASAIEAATGCRVVRLSRSSGLAAHATMLVFGRPRTVVVHDGASEDDLLAAVFCGG